MRDAVHIRPALDGDGFSLEFGETKQWFAEEHHAIGYAQDVFPDFDIVLFGATGGIRRRYSPGTSVDGQRTDSSVVTPSPKPSTEPPEE